jgi:glycosyltransferase involved in cell wall biosynthesis
MTLVAAARQLADRGVGPFRLLLAGRGQEADRCKRYCEDHGLKQVEFLGQIDWVHRLYSEADIVAVPSEWEEACSFSLIEAMACGACLVVSDAGGNSELVGGEGGAALIYRKGDADALAEQLAALLADPESRARMRRASRARAVEEFGLDRMVERYAALIESLGTAG